MCSSSSSATEEMTAAVTEKIVPENLRSDDDESGKKEHLRHDDEAIDLCGSESMSFDDDIEVLEESMISSVTAPAETTARDMRRRATHPSPMHMHQGSLAQRLGINFQWPSARTMDNNNKLTRRQQQRGPSVRHEANDKGYCVHHPNIQLYRQRSGSSNNDWIVVRKKCPSCISEDCPQMLGDDNTDSSIQIKDFTASRSASCPNLRANTASDAIEAATSNNMKKRNSFVQKLVDDFGSNGDQKILRAVGRTATVNAAVLLTAATGGVGASSVVAYATGGTIAAKRLSDGIAQNDEKEVTKSLAVYGAATGASIAGQALTGALMIGVAGASLPVAGAVAFSVGCASGITAGALSEWTVDGVMDKIMLRRCSKDVSSGSNDTNDIDRGEQEEKVS